MPRDLRRQARLIFGVNNVRSPRIEDQPGDEKEWKDNETRGAERLGDDGKGNHAGDGEAEAGQGRGLRRLDQELAKAAHHASAEADREGVAVKWKAAVCEPRPRPLVPPSTPAAYRASPVLPPGVAGATCASEATGEGRARSA